MDKEFFCNVCNNTGCTSMAGSLDCIAPGCEAATTRAAFDKWLLREGYGFSGIKEWSIYRHAVRTELESMALVMEENEKLKTALEEMQGRMGALIQEKAALDQRLVEMAQLHAASEVAKAVAAPAAPAAAVVTVDTPEFQRILGSYADGVAGQWELINHIDAHTAEVSAKAREEGNTQGWVECEADMKPEYDAMRQRAEKAEADILALYDRQRADGNTIAALREQQDQAVAQALDVAQDALTEVTTQRDALREQIARERAAAPQQPVAIPDGWSVRKENDGDIVVSKHGVGGYAARHDDNNIASAILHAFAADILAAPQQHAQAAEPPVTEHMVKVQSEIIKQLEDGHERLQALRAKYGMGNAQAALSDEKKILPRMPSIPRHLYEEYPAMSAQAHQKYVQDFAREYARRTLDFYGDPSDIASQQPAAAPSAPEPCPDPALCEQKGCANPRGRCEEATPPTPPQEAAARDERAISARKIPHAFSCKKAVPNSYHAACEEYCGNASTCTSSEFNLERVRAANAAIEAEERNQSRPWLIANGYIIGGIEDAALAAPAAQVAMSEGWRVVEKQTHYALCEGNTVVASLTGPDATENAAIIAVAIESARTAISARHAAPALPAAKADAVMTEQSHLCSCIGGYAQCTQKLPCNLLTGDTPPARALSQLSTAQGEALSQHADWCPECHARESMAVSEFDQGRAAGIEETSKALNNAGFGGECFDAAIRALNKQEPTA